MLPAKVSGLPPQEDKKKILYVSSSLDEKENVVIIKAVNITDNIVETTVELQNVKVGTGAKTIVLSSDNLKDENFLDNPKKVSPVEMSLSLSDSTFNYVFKSHSLTVLRVPIKK